jgi:hypothetical protein
MPRRAEQLRLISLTLPNRNSAFAAMGARDG